MRSEPADGGRRPLARVTTLAAAVVACAGLGVPGAAAAPRPAEVDGSAALDGTAGSRVSAVDAERQADLVTGEDQRLMAAQQAGLPTRGNPVELDRPYRVRSGGLFTLVLPRRRAPYTFDELRELAPETLLPQGGNAWLLREHVLVSAGATLVISPRRKLTLRLSSGPEGFVSLVTVGGRLRLDGTAGAPIAVQSWDESRGRPDTDLSDGRAYVRASGGIVVAYAKFSQLGFWSGRTGGLSVVGSGAATGKDVGQGTAAGGAAVDRATKPATGTSSSRGTELVPAGKLPSAARDPGGSYAARISDATMTGNAFGLFITGSSGPTITRTKITRSLVDGLVLHRDVDSAKVQDVVVEHSGVDGIVVARRVEGAQLSQVTARANGRDGIVLAGRPLAGGPSASGSSTRAFGNNTLTASTSVDNARIGVHVIGGTAVHVQNSTIQGGRSGIVVSDGAQDVDVDSNQVSGAASNGIQVRESSDVSVSGNVIRDSATGIHVRNASGLLKQNATSGVTLHGITFVGDVSGSVADGNRLAGSGTSAIDLVRVADKQEPTVGRNDLAGWSQTVTGDSLMSVLLHPLTVIWILVAMLLLAMSRPRKSVRELLPYAADPLGHRAGPLTPTGVAAAPAGVPTAPAAAPVPATTTAPPGRPGRRSSRPGVVRLPAAPPPVTAPTPVVGHGPPGRNGRPTRPTITAAPAPPPSPTRPPAPPVTAPREPVPSGRAVIDLAIHESRLSPAPPRRRRVNSR